MASILCLRWGAVAIEVVRMTREEAIKIIRREYSCVDRDCDIERSCGKCPYSIQSKELILKAYCLAVEALELVTSYEGTINKLTEALNQQKEGHWITWKEAGNEIASETRFECSVCHDSAQTLCNGLDLLSPYCPNCGARMESDK